MSDEPPEGVTTIGTTDGSVRITGVLVLTPRDVVVELLRTLEEAATSWDSRASGGGVLLMPSLWNEGSYAELQLRLGEMRDDPRWRPAWWHASHRWRWGETRKVVVPVRQTRSGVAPVLPRFTELVALGQTFWDEAGRRRVMEVRLYRWSEYVDLERAELGATRLVERMHGGNTELLRLPSTFLWRRLGVPAPDERPGYVAAR